MFHFRSLTAPISKCYGQILTFLQELEVKADPLKRAHQRKLSSFTQEVEAIIENLKDQRFVLEDLQNSLLFGDTESGGSSPFDESSSMEISTIADCICLINEKIEGFEDMTDQASQISADVRDLLYLFISLLPDR